MWVAGGWAWQAACHDISLVSQERCLGVALFAVYEDATFPVAAATTVRFIDLGFTAVELGIVTASVTLSMRPRVSGAGTTSTVPTVGPSSLPCAIPSMGLQKCFEFAQGATAWGLHMVCCRVFRLLRGRLRWYAVISNGGLLFHSLQLASRHSCGVSLLALHARSLFPVPLPSPFHRKPALFSPLLGPGCGFLDVRRGKHHARPSHGLSQDGRVRCVLPQQARASLRVCLFPIG